MSKTVFHILFLSCARWATVGQSTF